MNIEGWTFMVALGFNAAISVRVSNELGAGHPNTAKFSVIIASITSLLAGVFLSLVLLFSRSWYPPLFSNSEEVQQVVYELTPMLAVTIIVSSLQPTLSGVAIGAGWQAYVAYVNIACYYLFGIPIGLTLGFLLDIGVKGIWYGMLAGMTLQTGVLIMMVLRTNWNKEASLARDRIKQWGGDSEVKENGENLVS
ncbi:PREDICTED: protein DETOXIFICATION 29-like [Nicotiana attenuata]|uniref:Protein detoxification 32 n=1 Tax=Nicotiana attenuata TaxID=49451 RepID=A0A1J6KNI6_NICAT|nr:PREDICTED: protein DETOXIFICATION 29-like [Nicotiana attenuata]OIT26432.1 protein detoxification 32 [Nicotiana attenuata]